MAMPYKNKKKSNENNRRWYAKHKAEQQKRGRDKYHRDKEKYDAYRNRPDIKAREKAQKQVYNQLPEVKAKKLTYARSDKGKANKQVYRQKNKVAIATIKRRYYLENRDDFLKKAAQNYQTCDKKHRKKVAEHWRLKNPDNPIGPFHPGEMRRKRLERALKESRGG
jgi:hypothetical protein